MLLTNSKYKGTFLSKFKHLHTILPSYFSEKYRYEKRERLELADGDFVDLDWSSTQHDRVILILHGLESGSDRFYIKHSVSHLSKNGYDVVVMNFRGCSGEPNRLHRAYHNGDTEDVNFVLKHLSKNYDIINIVGFSVGGNVLLKYLGESVEHIPAQVKKTISIAAPIDLEATVRELSTSLGGFYQKHFVKNLVEKLKLKLNIFPEQIDLKNLKLIKTFEDFDNYHTAPVHGFENAQDYWKKASSKPFLKSIQTPTLFLSALDDPFLPEECYPIEELKEHQFVHLELPEKGGHLGFVQNFWKQECWYPKRILQYFSE